MKELVYYNVKTLTWDTSEMKELVDQGVQGALLIPTEPIVLHKTTRRVQRVSNKGLTTVGIQQQSMGQRAYGNNKSS